VIAALAAAALLACPAGSLHGRVTHVDGAAGTILLHVQIRSTRSCSVRGYPTLRLLGPNGPLPTHVQHGGLAVLLRPIRTIPVAPGRPAHLLVAYNDVPRSGETRCARGTALLVGAVRVAVVTHACGHGRLLESPYLR
jgi:uncharacterized protein DUF4232